MSDTLERGEIYFFYRPVVEEEHPDSMTDVQRFFLVLHPRDENRYRLIVVGQKKLPEAETHDRYWGFVDRVAHTPKALAEELSPEEYETKTRGERHQPGARAAGEGVYKIVRHDGHTELAYVLELPEEPGEVQRGLHIHDEGSFVLSIKNPEAGSPPGVGLEEDRKPELPDRLQDRFGDNRFADADPPDFLNHEGTELLLIGAHRKVLEADTKLEPDRETERSADVFSDLHLDREENPVRPLFEGTWE